MAIAASSLYSFRFYSSVVSQVDGIAPADTVLVSEIEAALLEANQNYVARHYQAAIDAYLKAQALIYSQIDSGAVLGIVRRIVFLPRDASLFDPLLSASVEWTNVLPVAGPVSSVRPRVAVAPATLSSVTALEGAGLSSPTLSTVTGMQAAADLHLAQTLTTLGNTAAATFYSTRASQTNAAVVQALHGTPTPVAPAPAAPAPAAPAPATHAVATPAAAAENPALAAASAATRFTGVGETLNLSAVSANIHTMPASAILAAPIAVAPVVTLPAPATVTRTLGILAGGKVTTISWAAGSAPALADIKTAAYAGRVAAASLNDTVSLPATASDFIVALPHTYFYAIPLGLAQCYQALGDWTNAEKFYLQAASYQFLNTAVEVPYLWLQLASLYLDWGNQLYMSGDAASALPIYQKVLNADGTAPTAGALYTTASLAAATTAARGVISNLAALVANPASAVNLNLDPQLCSVILEVRQRMVQMAAGLDFWGHWAPRVPIWTFDYLQQVAINYAQLAIAAEQQVISYWDRADQGQLTQLQLVQQVAQANAEVSAAQTQTQAAQAEQAVYQAGLRLAQQRATDAQANATEYQATSAAAIVHQALQAQLGGGDDGDAATLNAYADTMMSGSYSLSDSGATLAAAEQLTAARLSQEYEVDSLKRTAAELQTAQAQAQAELNASTAQVNAALAAQAVASLKAQLATQMVAAFDSQTFTPDVWQAMGNEMF
ncbi:MAG: tetratricopeptide repeat protein, partial [Chloroflexi bacterium]|nr:tetratricopeptide repeat protein [Chloroflexota bacterium]